MKHIHKGKQLVSRYALNIGRFVAHSSLPEVFLVASLIFSRYLPNSDFSYPSEVILPIILFSFLGTLFFYLYKQIFKDSLAAHAATLPLLYGLYAYSYTFSLFHSAAEWLAQGRPYLTALAFIVIVGIVCGVLAFGLKLLLRKVKFLQELPLLKIAVFALCFIFAVQVVKVAARLWTVRHQLAYSYQSPTLYHDTSKQQGKPNIYYLVFDRYTSSTVLARNFNYDNSKMITFLSDQGFVTRENAFANYPFTSQSLSSTLSMDYLKELGDQFKDDAKGFQTAFPFRDILDKPPVAQELMSQGYAYNQVSSWWDFSRNNPTATSEPTRSFRLTVLGKRFWLTDLQRDIVNKSILSPLLLHMGSRSIIKYDLDRNPRENFDRQISALKEIAEASGGQKRPAFTFAHILSPHDPYVFTETGEEPQYSGDRTDDGLDETAKYTKQLTYVNTQFQFMIKEIRQKDPNAVVIIQADEGPYPKAFRGPLSASNYYDPTNLSVDQMQQKFGILASYYLPGVSEEVIKKEMDSSVNTFRFVLNHYLGYKLDQLPDCHFSAGNKHYMYNFRLVNSRLTGLADPEECKQYQ